MANFNFNKVILGGRLTEDPELRTTPSGVSVTTFTIAVNRRFAKETDEQKADFFTVTAWRQTAEFITKFFRKASNICITGEIQTRSWTDDQGLKRYGVTIVADEAHFVDKKDDSPATAQAGTYAPPMQYNAPQYSAPKFEEIAPDEELPF